MFSQRRNLEEKVISEAKIVDLFFLYSSFLCKVFLFFTWTFLSCFSLSSFPLILKIEGTRYHDKI